MSCNQHDLYFSHCHGHPQKPIEIYVFIDPLSPDCWLLEPAIKKLKIKYGRFFTLRIITSSSINALNRKRKKHLLTEAWGKFSNKQQDKKEQMLSEQIVASPYLASLALKAAELQGRKCGMKFLRLIQEALFCHQQDVTNEHVLLENAKNAGLDVEEFQKDVHSQSAVKALKCDMKIAAEMDVSELPTFAFFNTLEGDEGLKISGAHSYDVYEEVLFEMIGEKPTPSEHPPLEWFIAYFQFVAAKEIAVVYDLTLDQVEREMKKLVFARKAERVQVHQEMFWRYKENNDQHHTNLYCCENEHGS
ncbi:ClpXP adapter SpxH family protein [Bacillus sp. NPDC077027]|uniref:ClpXP adapter SpxH family protein n=1 Tax=Bacillus sp. NPDC077027 TaxID=3390548 RepID=UPI003D01121D